MEQPMIIAYHLIWTVYGWWLPNDLRGSTSRIIRKDYIEALGELHFGRKRIQPSSKDIRAFYEQAAKTLKHELREIRGRAVDVVADAFAQVIARERYTCYACAIMPDHVHILIRKHKHTAGEMIEALQSASYWAMAESKLFPPDHPVWTRGGGWKVFLDHPDEVERILVHGAGVDGALLELGSAEVHLGDQCKRLVRCRS
jgi:hypothetical protein